MVSPPNANDIIMIIWYDNITNVVLARMNDIKKERKKQTNNTSEDTQNYIFDNKEDILVVVGILISSTTSN